MIEGTAECVDFTFILYVSILCTIEGKQMSIRAPHHCPTVMRENTVTDILTYAPSLSDLQKA